MTGRFVAREKSRAFALRVVKSCQYLQSEKQEYVLSRQLLRSGTAIGALVREAEYAESRADCRQLLRILTAIIKTTKSRR